MTVLALVDGMSVPVASIAPATFKVAPAAFDQVEPPAEPVMAPLALMVPLLVITTAAVMAIVWATVRLAVAAMVFAVESAKLPVPPTEPEPSIVAPEPLRVIAPVPVV